MQYPYGQLACRLDADVRLLQTDDCFRRRLIELPQEETEELACFPYFILIYSGRERPSVATWITCFGWSTMAIQGHVQESKTPRPCPIMNLMSKWLAFRSNERYEAVHCCLFFQFRLICSPTHRYTGQQAIEYLTNLTLTRALPSPYLGSPNLNCFAAASHLERK